MSGTQFDPDAPEGAPNLGAQYVSKRDVIVVSIVVVVIVVSLIMLFPIMRRQTDAAACKQNMSKIAASVSQYAEMNDGRFPPLYDVGENGTPFLTEGKPVVWASVLPPLPKGSSFFCPAAKKGESVRVNGKSLQSSMFQREDQEVRYIDLSYGMFAALSARAVSDVANGDQTIMLAETSNHGAGKTYNPMPFTLEDGTDVPFDGFAIGFNDAQVHPTGQSKFVTRLAFGNTADGDFKKKTAETRHQGMIFGIFVDGHLGKLTPDRAAIKPNDYTWVIR